LALADLIQRSGLIFNQSAIAGLKSAITPFTMTETISRRQLFKRDFHVLRGEVSAAISAADPINLLALGAPADEYAPEVDAILLKMPAAQSQDDVHAVVHEAFVQFFGPETAGGRERYAAAAAAIWQAVVKSRKK
jgi:hypothetical protein